jgi:predicted nucleic acid-binding protein
MEQHGGDKKVAAARQAVVADASVLVKWFVSEPFSNESLRLRNQHVSLQRRIVVPSLARYEVLNALKYADGFGTQELVRIAKDLEDFQFVEVPLNGNYGELTVQIASDYGITIYDSSYISLGKLENLSVFTADEKLLEKLEGEKDFNFVRHISKVRT